MFKYVLWVCSVRSNTPPDSLQRKVFECYRSVGWNLPPSTSSRWITNKCSGISCTSVPGHVARWRRTWDGAVYNSGLVKKSLISSSGRASDCVVFYYHYEVSHWGVDKDSDKIYEWSEEIYQYCTGHMLLTLLINWTLLQIPIFFLNKVSKRNSLCIVYVHLHYLFSQTGFYEIRWKNLSCVLPKELYMKLK